MEKKISIHGEGQAIQRFHVTITGQRSIETPTGGARNGLQIGGSLDLGLKGSNDHMFICTYVCMNVYIYIYIHHIYISYIHIYIYINIYII